MEDKSKEARSWNFRRLWTKFFSWSPLSSSTLLPKTQFTFKGSRKFSLSSPTRKFSLPEAAEHLHKRVLSWADFDLGPIVGTGSYSHVQLATFVPQKNFFPPLVLKICNKVQMIAMKQVKHMIDERKILYALNHPYIVKLLGSFQSENHVVMIMEFVNGGELFCRLRDVGRFSHRDVVFYAAEIVSAITHLHEQNIAYRDLKPENILLDSRGHIKLTDFGFAKYVIDRTWTLCGTHEYLAPETIIRRGHGTAVDWWAMGILLFELLADHAPFTHENPLELYRMILTKEIEYPKHFRQSAKSLISRLLTKNPAERMGNLQGERHHVKNHRFFRRIDWPAIEKRQVSPPYVPSTSHPWDASRFDSYSKPVYLGRALAEHEQIIFQDF